MSGAFEDLREALRLLIRDARFSVLALLLLGLGMGATVSVFAVFDALLFRPLPVSRPDSLVRVVRDQVRLGPRSDFGYTFFTTLREHSRSLEDIAATHQTNAGYQDQGESERVRLETASASYFALFQARPYIGRVILKEDESSDSTALPAVLSFRFWQRRYGGDGHILGRKILIQNQPFILVGVARKEFHGATVESSADVWAPLRAIEVLYPGSQSRDDFASYEIFARLPDGVSLSQARDESYSLFRATIEKESARTGERPELLGDFRLEPIPRGVSRMRTQFSGALRFLMAASGVLGVMAATSVMGLLLARFAARAHEFSTRLALGASPGRLFRLATFESLLLSTGGGMLGVLLTAMTAAMVPRVLPPVRLLDATTVPLALRVEIDWRVLAFLFFAILATTALAAAAPAVRIARTDPWSALRAARATGRARGRSLLVVFQIGLCTLLLTVAAQLAFTLRNLRALDPGFTTKRVVSFAVEPRLVGKDGTQMGRLIETWKEQVKALPGVRSAALSGRPLMHGTGQKTTVAQAGQRAPRSDFLNTSIHGVTPEYFDTLGLRIHSGRNFLPSDFGPQRANTGEPRIVNEAFVNRFFPEGSALGKRFGTGVEVEVKPKFQIIGIVTNARYRSLREPLQPTMYGPWAPGSPAVLYVRTDAAPSSLVQPVRELLRRLAPELPIHEITTLDQEVETSLSGEKLLAGLACSFGFLAVLIVAMGLFGLLSFVVTQRTREIGIRIAVGAQPIHILSLISIQTLRLTAAGIGIGLLAAYHAARGLESLLYEVSAQDPAAWLFTVPFVIAVSAAAAAVPTLRALRIQPASALRGDG